MLCIKTLLVEERMLRENVGTRPIDLPTVLILQEDMTIHDDGSDGILAMLLELYTLLEE